MRDVDQLVKFNEFAPVNEKFSSVPGLLRQPFHIAHNRKDREIGEGDGNNE